MPFELMPLPYAKDALEPYMSARTLEFHHDKHHKTYVDTLNKLIENSNYAAASLEDIIEDTYGNKTQEKVFNNAGQVWNHDFFWRCMTRSGMHPAGNLAREIDQTFGDFATFKKQFVEAATGQFGSGWAMVGVDRSGKLTMINRPNQDTPLMDGGRVLFANDVWEHAYYLKYQNRRADYLAAWWNVVNWQEVAKRYDAARAGTLDV